MCCKNQKAPEGRLEPSVRCAVVFIQSYNLSHEVSHSFCHLILQLTCCVGIGAKGKSRVVVTYHTDDGPDVKDLGKGHVVPLLDDAPCKAAKRVKSGSFGFKVSE